MFVTYFRHGCDMSCWWDSHNVKGGCPSFLVNSYWMYEIKSNPFIGDVLISMDEIKSRPFRGDVLISGAIYGTSKSL